MRPPELLLVSDLFIPSASFLARKLCLEKLTLEKSVACICIQQPCLVQSWTAGPIWPQALLLHCLRMLIQQQLLGLKLLQLLGRQIQQTLLHQLPQLLPPLQKHLSLTWLMRLLLTEGGWLGLLHEPLLRL